MNEFDYFLVQVHVPEESVDEMVAALQKIDVLHISVCPVTNYYKKVIGTRYSAARNLGELVVKDEVKIEVKLEKNKLGYVLHAIQSIHPYDNPTVNTIPIT